MSVARPEDDELTVRTGGKIVGGWTAVSVTRGVDQLPSVFSVETTETMPGDPSIASISPGDPVQIYLGSDLILTGYLNVDGPHIDKESHAIAWAGRSKTQDLVDCSVLPPDGVPTWQVTETTLAAAAKPLCKPFGIDVVLPDGDFPLDQRYPFIIQPGMTVFQLIEQMARTVQALVWDDANGNLVLSKIGAKRAGTALVEGQNLEVAEARLSDDQRFSDIYVMGQGSIRGPDGKLHGNFLGHATDPGVKRYRPHVVVIDLIGPDPQWPKKYADWEVHRRFGRSQQRIGQVTGWRCGDGALWYPNTRATVVSPTMKSTDDKIIAQCTWTRNAGGGTRTRLLTMPPEGLSVAPFHFSPPVPGAVAANG